MTMSSSMQELFNNIMIASNSIHSSVMFKSVRQFRNPNHRGATMKMNSDALEFVSY